jgi:hypothetical protein
MHTKYIARIALITTLILLIPLIAMRYTDEVQWTLSDFIAAGVLLFGAGFAYTFIMNTSHITMYRIATTIAVTTALVLVWMNLAVGIIGSEENPANLLYGAVLVTLFLGTLLSRFRALGMAHTLYATACVQMLVPIVAFSIWRPDFSLGVIGVFVLNAFFAGLFAISGILFKRSLSM